MAVHTVHDYGIEHGLESGCEECERKHLDQLDARNIAFVTGVTLAQWHTWLDAGPEWVFYLLDSVTARTVLEMQGRCYTGIGPGANEQRVIVVPPKGWVEPEDA